MVRAFLLLIALAVALPSGGAVAVGHVHDASHSHAPATTPGELPRDQPSRGLVYDGLRPAQPGGPCDGGEGAGLLEIRHQGRTLGCTHGPDPAPPGVDVRDRDSGVVRSESTATEVQGPPCVGGGGAGYRVQAIYAYPQSGLNRYSTLVDEIRTAAVSDVDTILDASAAKTGGSRLARFVTDPQTCEVIVEQVALTTNAVQSFGSMIALLETRGFVRPDRKYLVWVDANVYCGIAELYLDDSPGQNNNNNGRDAIPGMVARVDRNCWGDVTSSTPVEAHELMHNLGGVQNSAPHTSYIPPGLVSPGGHCTDEYDVMCYDDDGGGPVMMTFPCPPSSTNERLFDCNDDDYFNTAPAVGSYLDTKWNTARSRFLETGPPGASPSGPANDHFDDATVLVGSGPTGSGTTLDATKQADEPTHAAVAGGSSVWYEWQQASAGQAVVETAGSDFDTVLAVYEGSAVGSLTPVASNDDVSGSNPTSRVTFQTSPTATYRIVVDGWGGETGDVELGVSTSVQPEVPPAGGGPVSLSLIASRYRVVPGARVKVTAILESCAGGEAVELRGGGRTFASAASGSCQVSHRIRIFRKTTFRATSAGLQSNPVKIRLRH